MALDVVSASGWSCCLFAVDGGSFLKYLMGYHMAGQRVELSPQSKPSNSPLGPEVAKSVG